MFSFEELMKLATDEIVDRFNSTIQEYKYLSKEDYICIFISTFVSSDCCSDDSDYTHESLHNAVDGTSLCCQEINFFHMMIDCNEPNETFISALLNIYSQIKGLSKCQLGVSIKRCLDSSKELKFID
jgi:hypothetical protein